MLEFCIQFPTNGCETGSDSRVYGNKVLRAIFEANRDEMVEDWRSLHNEELCKLPSSSNIISMAQLWG
jgi:hypothetical protein